MTEKACAPGVTNGREKGKRRLRPSGFLEVESRGGGGGGGVSKGRFTNSIMSVKTTSVKKTMNQVFLIWRPRPGIGHIT